MSTINTLPPVSSLPLDLVELRHKRRESALTQLVAAAETAGAVRDGEILLATLLRAQRTGEHVVGRGFAAPHARSFAVLRPALLLGRSARGVDWGAADGEPVHLVALLLSPAATPAVLHVDRLTATLHALRLQRTRQRLLEAEPGLVASVFLGAGA